MWLRFIIAKLLVDSILSSLTVNQIRAAIKRLPAGMLATYNMIMERIRRQDPRLFKIGFEVLSWIYCAKTRLTVTELQHVVSLHLGLKDISDDDLVGEDILLSACCGLVSFVEDRQLKTMICQFSRK